MNKTEHMPHVESVSLVAPDAITWPQGHREEADCRFGKFNKIKVNHIRQNATDMEISPHQAKIRRNDCRCGGFLFGG